MAMTMNPQAQPDEVQEVESCFVPPSEETPIRRLWLSILDVVATRGYIPTVYFYRRDNTDDANFFDVGRLKKSMAKALVPFYPLAGRLSVDSDGRLEIDCNGKGALFVVTRSDFTIDFSDVKPSPELSRLFIPLIEDQSILLAIQVTLLRCGGVALGTALHHSAIDALSAFHFFQTWSAFCRDSDFTVEEPPCHERTLLRARSPPILQPNTSHVFGPKHVLYESLEPNDTKVFTISHDQLALLRQACGDASTFSAAAALVWRCMCEARELPLDAQTRVIFPVNIRHRLSPPLPHRYFGNGIVQTYVAASVKDIVMGTLAAVAARIKGTLDLLDDKLLRSAIDYNEMAGQSAQPTKGNLKATELLVASWLGMPRCDADFGWGKPRVMSIAEVVRGGFLYMLNGRDVGGGGVRVVICMEASKMEEFERLLYAKFISLKVDSSTKQKGNPTQEK